MDAISQDVLGGPEVLTPVTLPRPEPGLGEVLVRVHAAGVNPADVLNREHGVFSGQPPFVLGWDVSGTIEAVGPGVTLHSPGDEVFGMLPFPHGHGAYAEYAAGPTRAFIPKPSSLDHEHAAALPLAGLTAWQALVETAGVGEGTRVLINGAAGGVGHLAVQIAKARGAHVTAIASTSKVDFVRRLGADQVIDYTSTEFEGAAADVDVMLEVVGGAYPARALTVIRAGGILVSTLPQTLADVAQEASARGIRLAGLFVEADRMGMTALADLVDTGALRPTVSASFPLAQAGAAQAAMSGPGKTVLTLR